MPYSTILSKDLYQDLTQYHLVPNWQSKFNNLTPRKAILNIPIDSKLINSEQAALICFWIQGNNENNITNKFKKVYYEFQLLTRGSRDGFTGNAFHKLCDNKGPTVTILRLKNEASILGGYDPLNWKSNDGNGTFEKTSDSFIFSLDREIILSRVQGYDTAIGQYRQHGPIFGDLRLLNTFNATNGVHCLNNNAYERNIHNEGHFIADEYEVFSVVRRRK